MSHQQSLIDLFIRHGYRLTLGQILEHPFGYEARARFTELRRQGWIIRCERNTKEPSKNLYIAMPPEKTGQVRFL